MADAFSWTCPYCNAVATITDSNTSNDRHDFNRDNKDGPLALLTKVIVCPHPKCREYQLRAILYKTKFSGGGYSLDGTPLLTWQLKPRSTAKQFPPYIPKPIIDDYEEACLIASDSPKASATLSRRCLQGMMRDFWHITESRLVDEIDGLHGKVDSTTWDAIDAVRKIGNIGAHMEKDINLIVDVDPDEAQLLIGLIESLLQAWYVERYEREQQMQKVIALAAAKQAAKQTTGGTP
jgi:Domain of unknown function (DUF4145)